MLLAGRKNSTVWRIRHRGYQPRRSCENPMHEPPRRLPQSFVKPLPVKPVSASLGILDSEIIAGRCLLMPPFGCNAFRPFRAGDPVRDAPPAEMERRTFGHFGSSDFDRLGLAKKTNGTFRHGRSSRPG